MRPTRRSEKLIGLGQRNEDEKHGKPKPKQATSKDLRYSLQTDINCRSQKLGYTPQRATPKQAEEAQWREKQYIRLIKKEMLKYNRFGL
jgi:hypothetical protein